VFLAGVAVAAYATGLFTANAYLNRIGVADFAQLRARFVFTGAIVLLAFAAAFLLVHEAWSGLARRGRLIAVGCALAAVVVWWVVVSLPKGGVDEDDGFGRSEFRHALVLESGALLAGFAGAWLWRRFWGARANIALASASSEQVEMAHPTPGYADATRHRWRERVDSALLRVPAPRSAIAAASAVLVGAALFVSQFDRHVYPRIPVPYGGGKAVCGRLLLAEGAETELEAFRLPAGTGRATAFVPIAYEADDADAHRRRAIASRAAFRRALPRQPSS
jgi:hypothetical protein